MNSFEALVEPYRATLRLHCYRMLGSSHDSDDMVQETFVRALRAQHTLEDPALARAWLHRIATNVCIDELAKRPRRARGPELGPAADPEAPPLPATRDSEWLEPMPSADRKVIHDALIGRDDVTTRSEGEDPVRRVVIAPATPAE